MYVYVCFGRAVGIYIQVNEAKPSRCHIILPTVFIICSDPQRASTHPPPTFVSKLHESRGLPPARSGGQLKSVIRTHWLRRGSHEKTHTATTPHPSSLPLSVATPAPLPSHVCLLDVQITLFLRRPFRPTDRSAGWLTGSSYSSGSLRRFSAG